MDKFNAETAKARIIEALRNYDTGRGWDENIHCCLTGKDADLEPWGRQGITVDWVDTLGVHATVRIGKTEAGNNVCLNLEPEIEEDDALFEEAREAYLDMVTECLEGPLSWEWDGDGWFGTLSFPIAMAWTTNATEGKRYIDFDQTARELRQLAELNLRIVDAQNMEQSALTDALAGWRMDPSIDSERCEEGKPGPNAAWAYLNLTKKEVEA